VGKVGAERHSGLAHRCIAHDAPNVAALTATIVVRQGIRPLLRGLQRPVSSLDCYRDKISERIQAMAAGLVAGEIEKRCATDAGNRPV
jgi:hypothetical protein